MRKLLCYFGFHKYKITSHKRISENLGVFEAEKTCARCGDEVEGIIIL